MSTAAAAAGCCEHTPWAGHNACWMQSAINAGIWGWITLWLLIEPSRPEGNPDWWADPAVWVLFAAMIANNRLARRARRHNRSLCERCIAITPLDPERAVRKHRRALLAHHGWVDENNLSLPRLLRATVLALIPVLIVLAVLVTVLLSIWVDIPTWINVTGAVAFTTGAVAYPYIAETHRRLYPWCPFCADDDGWDDHGTPEPSPELTREKELT